MAQLNMVNAINLALREALQTDDNAILSGQDIGQDEGGVRVTATRLKDFGTQR